VVAFETFFEGVLPVAARVSAGAAESSKPTDNTAAINGPFHRCFCSQRTAVTFRSGSLSVGEPKNARKIKSLRRIPNASAAVGEP